MTYWTLPKLAFLASLLACLAPVTLGPGPVCAIAVTGALVGLEAWLGRRAADYDRLTGELLALEMRLDGALTGIRNDVQKVANTAGVKVRGA